ncbi:MAG: hypothetical protein V6Z81_09140 [Parvularculales bacterium]
MHLLCRYGHAIPTTPERPAAQGPNAYVIQAQKGVLFDEGFWKTATTADVEAALEGEADTEARDRDGKHPCRRCTRGDPDSLFVTES